MEEKDEIQQNNEQKGTETPFYKGPLPDKRIHEAYDPFNGQDPAVFYANLIGETEAEEEQPAKKRFLLLPVFIAGVLILCGAAFSCRKLDALPYIAPPATPAPVAAPTPTPALDSAAALLPLVEAALAPEPDGNYERTALIVDGKSQGVLYSREAAEELMQDVCACFEGIVREKYEVTGTLATTVDNEIEYLPAPETPDEDVVTAEALFEKLTASNTRLDVLCTETRREEALTPYKTSEEKDKYLLAGTRIVVEQGADGVESKTNVLLYKNGRLRTENTDEKLETRPMREEIIRIGAQKVTDEKEPGKKEGKKGPGLPDGMTFLSPVADCTVVLNYGQSGGVLHLGLDYEPKDKEAADVPVLAACKGTVVCVMDRGGYGRMLELDHGNGFVTRYAHLDGTNVQLGDIVSQGDAIGLMGRTGNAEARQLHFELRYNGEAYNPRYYLD